MPFNTQDLYQKGGNYYGQNSTNKKLIMFDRKTLPVPSGIVLGIPGSGKSFAVKEEMSNVLMRKDEDDEVLVIDAEREYTALAYGFDGEVIPISPISNRHLNALDINTNYAEDENPINLKTDFVLSLCELILSNSRSSLSSGKRSIISRVCTNLYNDYLTDPKNNKMPTLVELYEEIKKQPEEDAKSLALDLEIYATGTLSTFAHPTNVDVKKKFVIYDLKDLGKQLKTVGMLVVMDQIWNRVSENRNKGINTWIYIDESHLYLTNPFVAEFFAELYARLRKWGGIPTAITQNVERMLASDVGRSMLSNSQFVLLFNQATNDRNAIAQLCNLSPTQLSKVTNSKPGHGLLIAGGDVIPLMNDFPKDTKLYKMMTTKFDELSIDGVEEEQTWQL